MQKSTETQPRRAVVRRPQPRQSHATQLCMAGRQLAVTTITAVLMIATQPSEARSDDQESSPTLVRYTECHVRKVNGSLVEEAPSTVYADPKGGRRRSETRHVSDSGQILITSVQDQSKHLSLMTSSESRTTTLVTLPTLPAGTASSILEVARQLQRNEKTISTRIDFEGRETVKLHLDEGPRVWSTVWIDAKSNLPVRLQFDLSDPKQDATVDRYLSKDIEWNPMVEDAEALFATVAPEGYVLEDRTVVENLPRDVASLRQIESQVIDVAKHALPSVVQIREGTGTIINREGLILSQWHVSHAGPMDRPGQKVKVVLHDGRVRNAELLGADMTNDLSLLRLVEPGPYPFSPLGDSAAINIGDAVLKIGHPASDGRTARGAAVRLGRVVCGDERSVREHGVFVADCFVSGGDSGGPLFDLKGRLIGIFRASALTHAFRIWQAQKYVTSRHRNAMSYTASSFVQERVPQMQKGEVLGAEESKKMAVTESLSRAARLPLDCWTQGTTSIGAYREAVKKVRRSVVEIRNGEGDVVSLGVVVGADGQVVTKSKTLPLQPTCVLSDGRQLSAKFVGTSPKADLALLKVSAVGLEPILWGDATRLPAGTLIAVPGFDAEPVASGAISVACYKDPPRSGTIFEHDAGVLGHEYGGPIVDLNGRVIGISVSRTAYGSIAIPGDVVQTLLPELTSGNPRPSMND